jgi:hypothetical protein
MKGLKNRSPGNGRTRAYMPVKPVDREVAAAELAGPVVWMTTLTCVGLAVNVVVTGAQLIPNCDRFVVVIT